MDPNTTSSVEEVVKPVPQVSGFTDINMSNKREEDELFCDYRCRQWWIKRLTKFYLKGKVVWDGGRGQKIGSF